MSRTREPNPDSPDSPGGPGPSLPRTGRTGRPTKCTAALVARLCKAIREGSSLESACGVVGITSRRLRKWRELARQKVSPYTEFRPALKKAIAAAVGSAEAKVYAGKRGWQSSARWLESMYPKRWLRTWQAAEPPFQPPQLPLLADGRNLAAEYMAEFGNRPSSPGLTPQGRFTLDQ
jgi:hypothetical protein